MCEVKSNKFIYRYIMLFELGGSVHFTISSFDHNLGCAFSTFEVQSSHKFKSVKYW